jgi:hypothetical protein
MEKSPAVWMGRLRRRIRLGNEEKLGIIRRLNQQTRAFEPSL